LLLIKDIAIIGGGIGGCLAALTAAKLGKKVILTEETDWIGGQLTSQAVPPDEHPWIEAFGCTKTYRKFRQDVRSYYKKHYPLRAKAYHHDYLNPGNAWVSRISHEPKVALNIIYDYLQPYMATGYIEILLNHKIKKAEMNADTIQKVFVTDLKTGDELCICANFFLDATELGDVLPMSGAEYVIGAESKHDTHEPQALEKAEPDDIQSFTHVFALDFIDGGDFTIKKPDMYEEWRSYQPSFLKHRQLSPYIPDIQTGIPRQMPIFSEPDQPGLWEYRRIIDASQFSKGFFEGDISLINWPQNDYWSGSIIDVNERTREKHLQEAKQLSLSLLYWLQTEAPRLSGKRGYPEFRLRPDIVGTKDGFAKYPYIRESRRIKACHTIVEGDINAQIREDKGIKTVVDSVGIGAYRIDIHPTTKYNRIIYAESYPFEIPLGSFIPVKIKNLIPACKNIGTTQLTNGCLRVHHVEWNVGETAGALASYTIDKKATLKSIYNNPYHVKSFQKLLMKHGIPLHWPKIGTL